MPEDSTRRLLKLFGVAVTECEDALARLRATLRDAGGSAPGAAIEALAAYTRAARELSARLAEVNRLIADYQAGAEQALEAYLRACAGA